jgi:hypothetical protein
MDRDDFHRGEGPDEGNCSAIERAERAAGNNPIEKAYVAGAKKKWEDGVAVLMGLLEAIDKVYDVSWSYPEMKRVDECSESVSAALKAWKETF